MIVPFVTEVFRVVVWDVVRVSVLVHHWNKLGLKGLNSVDSWLFTCSFRILFQHRLVCKRVRLLVEWTDATNDDWLVVGRWAVVSDWHVRFVRVWTLQRCLNHSVRGLLWILAVNGGEAEGLTIVMHGISTLACSQHAILADDVNWTIRVFSSIYQVIHIVIAILMVDHIIIFTSFMVRI